MEEGEGDDSEMMDAMDGWDSEDDGGERNIADGDAKGTEGGSSGEEKKKD